MSARIERERVQLLTRTGLDWSHKYPSVVEALVKAGAKTLAITPLQNSGNNAATRRQAVVQVAEMSQVKAAQRKIDHAA